MADNGTGEPDDVAPPAAARIHVPDPDLGEPEESSDEPAGDGTEPPRPMKKTRRGSRGGRGRKKKTAAAVAGAGASLSADASGDEPPAGDETSVVAEEETPAVVGEEKAPDAGQEKASDWEYVPMSQWDDV